MPIEAIDRALADEESLPPTEHREVAESRRATEPPHPRSSFLKVKGPVLGALMRRIADAQYAR
jgi:hypothetical protein